jgi:ribosome assembly protein 1
VSEAGETLLLTAGEVHLQRCIRDLTESYAKCEVSVSDPIVPFRETIVTPPVRDMVNEAIDVDNRVGKQQQDDDIDSNSVTLDTPNKQCRFTIRAVPLPAEFTKLLEENQVLLKALASTVELTIRAHSDIDEFKLRLEAIAEHDELLRGCVERILCFGPKRSGPNILVNSVPGLQLSSVWSRTTVNRGDARLEAVSSVVNGFQLAALAGPICEEPMMGVAFVLEAWLFREEGETGWGPLSGQIVSTVKVSRCWILTVLQILF